MEKERIRAQSRLDLMQAVAAGLCGGDGYHELAESLIAQLED